MYVSVASPLRRTVGKKKALRLIHDVMTRVWSEAESIEQVEEICASLNTEVGHRVFSVESTSRDALVDTNIDALVYRAFFENILSVIGSDDVPLFVSSYVSDCVGQNSRGRPRFESRSFGEYVPLLVRCGMLNLVDTVYSMVEQSVTWAQWEELIAERMMSPDFTGHATPDQPILIPKSMCVNRSQVKQIVSQFLSGFDPARCVRDRVLECSSVRASLRRLEGAVLSEKKHAKNGHWTAPSILDAIDNGAPTPWSNEKWWNVSADTMEGVLTRCAGPLIRQRMIEDFDSLIVLSPVEMSGELATSVLGEVRECVRDQYERLFPSISDCLQSSGVARETADAVQKARYDDLVRLTCSIVDPRVSDVFDRLVDGLGREFGLIF